MATFAQQMVEREGRRLCVPATMGK